MQTPIITLTTDFGIVDSYVAQMKGIITGINREAKIIDVTHEIPPQDVFRGAMVLDEIVDCFPKGTIHVVVVDPGVGSQRRIIAAEFAGQKFVLPDNGLIERVRMRFSVEQLVEVTKTKFFLPASRTNGSLVSNTFHGRDILAPVAANLSLGVNLGELGPRIDGPLCDLPMSTPKVTERSIVGTIVWTDSYGNMITNIAGCLIPADQYSKLKISVGSTEIDGVSRYYSEVNHGQIHALINSSDYLEVAVNGGSAVDLLGVDPHAVEVCVAFENE